jgi:hypothetical protein
MLGPTRGDERGMTEALPEEPDDIPISFTGRGMCRAEHIIPE